MPALLKMDIPGTYFRVVYIPPREPNPNFPSATDKEATVEFYDRRHAHTPDGQFTGGRYLARTLLENQEPNRGLDLAGQEPEWTIDANGMRVVMFWLSSCYNFISEKCAI